MKGYTPPPRMVVSNEPMPITRNITITEGISVKDLAEKLGIRAKDLIARDSGWDGVTTSGLVAPAMAGRLMLGIAGTALLIAAAIPLDPASTQGTTIHRGATTIAMIALVAALLAIAPSLRERPGWRGYGRVSFEACSSNVITLVSAPKKRAISLASSASSV